MEESEVHRATALHVILPSTYKKKKKKGREEEEEGAEEEEKGKTERDSRSGPSSPHRVRLLQ